MNDEQDELDQLKKLYKSEELTSATADIVVKRSLRNLEIAKTIYAMSVENSNKMKTFTYPISKQRVYEGLEAAKQNYAFFQAGQTQAKVLRQTNLAGTKAADEAARLKLAELQSDAEKLVVHAPFDGVVLYGQVVNGNWTSPDPRAMRVGEHVTAQVVLMTLCQPGRLRIALDLPENRYFAIQPGQKASISPVAFPELKYDGVCEIGRRSAPGQGGYLMTIATGEVDPRLTPGMKAQIHMDVQLADNALLVPATAIANSTVWVKTPGGIEARQIVAGRTDGKIVEILSGLQEGDEVLTAARQ